MDCSLSMRLPMPVEVDVGCGQRRVARIRSDAFSATIITGA